MFFFIHFFHNLYYFLLFIVFWIDCFLFLESLESLGHLFEISLKIFNVSVYLYKLFFEDCFGRSPKFLLSFYFVSRNFHNFNFKRYCHILFQNVFYLSTFPLGIKEMFHYCCTLKLIAETIRFGDSVIWQVWSASMVVLICISYF